MLVFERWKIILVLVISLLGIVYAVPNFLSRSSAGALPTWLPHKQISLGLDLQGGSHLLLEVDFATVLTEQLEMLVDDSRVLLRGAGIGYTGLGRAGEEVTLKLRDLEEGEFVRDLLSEIEPGIEIEVNGLGFVIELKFLNGRKKINKYDIFSILSYD